MRTIEERYQNDPEFHQLVSLLEGMIRRLQFTPSETREAAMFAQMRVEMLNPRPTVFSEDLLAELRYRAGDHKLPTMPPSHHTRCDLKSCIGGNACFERNRDR